MSGSCAMTVVLFALGPALLTSANIVTAALKLVLCSMMIQWRSWTNRRRIIEVVNTALVYCAVLYMRLAV